MRAATIGQQLCKSCSTCLSFIACFILLVIAPLAGFSHNRLELEQLLPRTFCSAQVHFAPMYLTLFGAQRWCGELIGKNGIVGSTVAKWLTSPHRLDIYNEFMPLDAKDSLLITRVECLHFVHSAAVINQGPFLSTPPYRGMGTMQIEYRWILVARLTIALML